LLTIDLLENRRQDIVLKVKSTDWQKSSKKLSAKGQDAVDSISRTSSQSSNEEECKISGKGKNRTNSSYEENQSNNIFSFG